MKTNKWLYGQAKVPAVPEDFRNARINMLKRHLQRLLKKPNAVGTTQVNDVLSAIRFWEKLR